MKIKTPLILLSFIVITATHAQNSLSKSEMSKEQIPANISKERSWWNLLYYDISIIPDYNRKFISGTNKITFIALQPGNTMQVDLMEPMRILKITWKGESLSFTKQKDEYFIVFPATIEKGVSETIVVQFEGQPTEALNPPVDNGWIWSKDENGRPWISIACQGSGACIWLPCKDVLYDEPDNGASLSITIPDSLIAIGNGRLHSKVKNKNGTSTYCWKVVNPINNYNIVPYIGKYVSWHQEYDGLKGKLDCDFWVLDYNLERGKKHLQQTDTMLRAFEYWMGPYPFYEDSYKLVEAPMPGMEHQSAVAYGNGFQNGYQGKDFISGTSWGMKWDFMLVHESGHEWFGNNITSGNYGDGWIHEGFTKYLETLYTDFVFGNKAGNEYALGTWRRIKNDKPIFGTNTSDKYYKGNAMLHMIRQLLGDNVFRGWLIGLNKTFYHQTINTKQVLDFLNQYTNKDFSKIFAQYLQTIQVPILEYYFQKDELKYRWTNCVEGFNMPLNISLNEESFQLIHPTTEWKTISVSDKSSKTLAADKNFYIEIKQADIEK